MIDQIDHSEEWSDVNKDDRVWAEINNNIATLKHNSDAVQVSITQTEERYSAYLFIKGLNESISMLSAKASDDKDSMSKSIENMLLQAEALVKVTKLL